MSPGKTTMAAVTSLVAVLLLLQPAQALAQVAPAPARPVPVLVVGGAATAAVSMVAFGFAGALIGGNSCMDSGNPDSCRGMEGALWGAAVGYTVGIPLGVHLTNRRAGSLRASMLTSAAIAATGAAVGFGIGTNQSIASAALAAPILQMASSVIIERSTARRRAGGEE
jgi:hypothetical protein